MKHGTSAPSRPNSYPPTDAPPGRCLRPLSFPPALHVSDYGQACWLLAGWLPWPGHAGPGPWRGVRVLGVFGRLRGAVGGGVDGLCWHQRPAGEDGQGQVPPAVHSQEGVWWLACVCNLGRQRWKKQETSACRWYFRLSLECLFFRCTLCVVCGAWCPKSVPFFFPITRFGRPIAGVVCLCVPLRVPQNQWRGTHHYIIFGFFLLAASQVVILQVRGASIPTLRYHCVCVSPAFLGRRDREPKPCVREREVATFEVKNTCNPLIGDVKTYLYIFQETHGIVASLQIQAGACVVLLCMVHKNQHGGI